MHFQDDVPHTSYPMNQTTLSMPFPSDAGGYGYLPVTSASHDNSGSFGSFVPPSTLASPGWDIPAYTPTSWTGSSTTTYAMTPEHLGRSFHSNVIMDNALLDGSATDFPDTSTLLDSLPRNDQQPQDDYDEYDYEPQPPAPGPSSSPSQLCCEACDETFANQKNWDRHLLSEKHIRNIQDYTSDSVPKYKCACNYVQARKDNYRRHLKNCMFRIDFAYVCTCGDWTQDKAYHEQHIDQCGRKRRGRGPK
ncbi:hypothetical protein B0T21DRAFT_347572 [Apiosordaria backusii]|uniref:C2H2-type domain-containing protein n=1 Tax=Apiosordaria backusii TaxID=314023 RepID=A0AA40ED92_9PEZI|nr:hypothetical protein B0T21DRAFT_347572 [Apiosordaria backusii]